MKDYVMDRVRVTDSVFILHSDSNIQPFVDVQYKNVLSSDLMAIFKF